MTATVVEAREDFLLGGRPPGHGWLSQSPARCRSGRLRQTECAAYSQGTARSFGWRRAPQKRFVWIRAERSHAGDWDWGAKERGVVATIHGKLTSKSVRLNLRVGYRVRLRRRTPHAGAGLAELPVVQTMRFGSNSSQRDSTTWPSVAERSCVFTWMWRHAVRRAHHVSAVLSETSRRMRPLVLRPSGGR